MSEHGGVSAYGVRMARPDEADGIARVCRDGFAASSAGLLSPATVDRQASLYYESSRVRAEILSADETPAWQGYVVAATCGGRVLGAAGGGVSDAGVGNLLVLYVDLSIRGRGVGTALLDFVTQQQTRAGASTQWVSFTEGNQLGVPFYLARGFVVRDRVPFDRTDHPPEAISLRMHRAIWPLRKAGRPRALFVCDVLLT